MKIRVEELAKKVVVVGFNESDGLFTIATDEGGGNYTEYWGTREEWEDRGFPMEYVFHYGFTEHSWRYSEMIVSLAPQDGSFTYRKLPGRKYEYDCGSEMVGVVDIEERNRTLTEGDWW